MNCRDCREESETVFHVVGLKCMNESCGSYNTVRCGNEEIPEDAVPVRAEEYMEYLQQGRQQHDDDNQEDGEGEQHDDNQEDGEGEHDDNQEDGEGEQHDDNQEDGVGEQHDP